MKRHRLLPLLLVLIPLASSCAVEPLEGDVLLYAGPGADEDCTANLAALLGNLGYSVELAGPDYFNAHGCAGFRVAAFPGGDMFQYARDLEADAKEDIRRFLAEGGAYLGVCGGSYFAAARVHWQGAELPLEPLALFSGGAVGPIDEIAPFPECTITGIHADEEHPISADLEDELRYTYCYGPYFVLDEGAEENPAVLHRYDTGDGAASLAFAYDAGRVFIIGLHPELTIVEVEDGGTDYHPDSYALFEAALDWLLADR